MEQKQRVIAVIAGIEFTEEDMKNSPWSKKSKQFLDYVYNKKWKLL